MKRASNKSILFSFMILASFVVVFLFQKNSLKPKQQKGAFFGNGDENYCINDIYISKEGDKYYVSQGTIKVPGDNETIPIFINKIKDLSLDELASENTKKFGELGFADQNKVIVSMHGKKLELGGLTQQYDGTFVKPVNEQAAYRTSVILDKNNIDQFKYFQLKTLINLPQLQISKVTIKSSKRTVDLADSAKTTAAHLTSIDYLGTAKPLGESLEVAVQTDKETVKYIIGYDKVKALYWASVDNNNFFSISKTDFETLTSKVL